MSANASNLSMDEYGACLRDIAQDQRSAGGSVVFVQPISEVDFPNSPLFGQPEPGEPGTAWSTTKTPCGQSQRQSMRPSSSARRPYRRRA